MCDERPDVLGNTYSCISLSQTVGLRWHRQTTFPSISSFYLVFSSTQAGPDKPSTLTLRNCLGWNLYFLFGNLAKPCHHHHEGYYIICIIQDAFSSSHFLHPLLRCLHYLKDLNCQRKCQIKGILHRLKRKMMNFKPKTLQTSISREKLSLLCTLFWQTSISREKLSILFTLFWQTSIWRENILHRSFFLTFQAKPKNGWSCCTCE